MDSIQDFMVVYQSGHIFLFQKSTAKKHWDSNGGKKAINMENEGGRQEPDGAV